MRYINLEQALAARGERTYGYLPVAQRYDGTDIALPVMVVTGKQPGPTLLVDGCNHGDEHEGAEAVIKIARELDANQLRGTFIGVPVVNVLAFEQGDRFAPQCYYGADLNRSYPGSPDGQITQRIAYSHFTRLVSKADYVITTHGGGNKWTLRYPQVIYETTGNSEVDEKAMIMARGFGARFLWRGGAFKGTLRQEACSRGIPVVTAELGGQAIRDAYREECIHVFARGIINVMKALGMLTGAPEPTRKPIVLDTPVYMTNTHGGFYKPIKKSGDRVNKDEIVAIITDLFGEVVEVLRAPFDGIICSQWSYPMAVAGNWVVIISKVLEE